MCAHHKQISRTDIYSQQEGFFKPLVPGREKSFSIAKPFLNTRLTADFYLIIVFNWRGINQMEEVVCTVCRVCYVCTWAGDGRIGGRIGWWGLCTPVWQCLRGVCRGHKTSPAQLPTDLQSYTTESNMYKQWPQTVLIALDTKYQTKWNLQTNYTRAFLKTNFKVVTVTSFSLTH